MKRLLLSCAAAVLMLCSIQASAQDRTVSGKVTSTEDGSPLPGVNVVIKGTAVGTSTDADGKYSLAVPASGGSLVFSFIGLESKEFVIGTQSVVDVSLALDVQQLNEVVVTAGGLTVQRRSLGNQATTVKSTDITQGKSSNIAAGLSGKVPGLLVSAVSSGVNPTYRVVLRGNRSLTGNNQALIVLDNIITPNSILGNLNPEDIEDIQVLNGAGAAALYGSDASNGALIITTKRGKSGKTEIKIGHTTTFENVSYLPSLQKEFGSGTTPDDVPVYTPYENQQYGPRFDGTMREIGKPIEVLDPVTGIYSYPIQSVPYSATNARTDFWETGIQNQTDFAISTGDDKSSIYATAQYFKQESTVPWDEYKRYSFRVNMDRKVGETIKVGVSTNYIMNNYDISSAAGAAYQDVLMSPAQVDITNYKDWKNDPYANPNGYFNEYYDNPYFTLQNNRQETKNSYFQGSLEVKWNPIAPLTFTARLGINSRNAFSKTYQGKFVFTPYTTSISGGSKQTIAGNVRDNGSYDNQIISDFLGEYKTNLTDDLTLNVVAGVQTRENSAKTVGASAPSLAISGLYNVANTLNNFGANESNFLSRQVGVYGDVRFGYKEYLYLHLTGRNDWRSVLAEENRSFFYPAVDVSFIASDAIQALKNDWIDALKIRGGWSQVGQVNIGPYQLQTTYSQIYGYPYTSGGGFSYGNTVVSPSLKPEITTTVEAGFDLDLNKYNASVGFTVYKSNTVDQTIYVQTSSASGFNTMLTNVGEVENKGLETYVRVTPIQTSYGLEVTLGANYTLNRNEVIELSDQSDLLILSTTTGSRVVAKVGSPFPLLQNTTYDRTSEGKVIVDGVTGFPASNGTFSNVGITTPPHILGVNAEVKYKGFRLAANAEYRNGHFIFNDVASQYDFSGAGIRTTWYNRERFIVPNSAYRDPENPGTDEAPNYLDNNGVLTATGGADFWTDGSRNTNIGENYVNSAGFWKLREVSLRYDFPTSLLASTKYIKGASISVQGRNLFIWVPSTNYYTDPEYSANGTDSNAVGITNINQTPPARYIGATLSLTF